MLQVPSPLLVAFAYPLVSVKELSRQRLLSLLYGHLAQRLAAVVDGIDSSDRSVFCGRARMISGTLYR
ncbi:unnamed protein product [Taenia asiatica]|uniref:Secreted protein n=1 Tax=Taenia asiatica TaxID=60517 RepID=A0A0R3VW03_TAEAS|nr:unnamed protein product [Taenia asiatica]